MSLSQSRFPAFMAFDPVHGILRATAFAERTYLRLKLFAVLMFSIWLYFLFILTWGTTFQIALAGFVFVWGSPIFWLLWYSSIASFSVLARALLATLWLLQEEPALVAIYLSEAMFASFAGLARLPSGKLISFVELKSAWSFTYPTAVGLFCGIVGNVLVTVTDVARPVLLRLNPHMENFEIRYVYSRVHERSEFAAMLEDEIDILEGLPYAGIREPFRVVSLWHEATHDPYLNFVLGVTRLASVFNLSTYTLWTLALAAPFVAAWWTVRLSLRLGITTLRSLQNLLGYFLFFAFWAFWQDEATLQLSVWIVWHYLIGSLAWLITLPFEIIANFQLAVKFFKLLAAVTLLHFARFLADASVVFNRYKGDVQSNPGVAKLKLRVAFSRSWVRFQKVVAAVALPDFIRSAPSSYSLDQLRSTLERLQSLGVPIDIELSEWNSEDVVGADHPYSFSGSTFRQGIRSLITSVDQHLDLAPLNRDPTRDYRRTEEYATLQNEFDATSRYFKEVDYAFIDIKALEAWDLVGAIFEDSQLTLPSYVFKKWEKAYGLSPFSSHPSKPGKRKLSRRDWIKSVGGHNSALAIWKDIFYWSPSMVPVAPVSVKQEAIPARKHLKSKVRTIIGAPLIHYVMSTVFNYGPNHNFKYDATPIKVGMPLNGWGFAPLWKRHSRFDKHYAGDCSEFDSTLSDSKAGLGILNFIKDVRKTGFRRHKDFERIAWLIDVNYVQVAKQLLARTSTGNIHLKGTGASTGHSSTSMDNSLAMVALYFMAWKQITGLSASQFKQFNELSVQGDDHVLSIANDAPPGWVWGNIVAAMAQWGVTMNLEASGPLDTIEFLSKFGRRPTDKDFIELREAGIPVPDYVTVHNREKLIGKLAARVTSRDLKYQAVRLRSYMLLTAHHPDIYHALDRAITAKLAAIRKADPAYKFEVPTYTTVLRMWYRIDVMPASWKSESSDVLEAEDAGAELVYSYGRVTLLESALDLVARVADFLNPDVFNSSFSAFLQRAVREQLEWPLVFIKHANNVLGDRALSSYLRKSTYDWIALDHDLPLGDAADPGSLYLRHWLYLAFRAGQQTFGVFPRVVFFDKKLADWKYALFGKVSFQVTRLGVPIHDILLVALLSYVSVPFLPDFASYGRLQTFLTFELGIFADKVFIGAWNYFGSLTPPNFEAVVTLLPNLVPGQTLLVQAGTGTGKTTSMIRAFADKEPKVVVIVPRSAIASGVAKYMRDSFSLDATAYTYGSVPKPEAAVYYATPDELFLHLWWADRPWLFVIDEAHLGEANLMLAHKLLLARGRRVVAMTATPDVPHLAHLHPVQLRVAQVWKVDTVDLWRAWFAEDREWLASLSTYKTFMRMYITKIMRTLNNNQSRLRRVLIFVNTVEEATSLAAQVVVGRAYALYSGHVDYPSDTTVFVSTSVSDVGVTLPNIDVVYTTDVTIGSRFDSTLRRSELRYLRLPAAGLTQRRGRTGRMNNGTFAVCRAPDGLVAEWYEPSLRDHFESLVMAPAGVHLIEPIAAAWPELLRDVFATEDVLDDLRVENLQLLVNSVRTLLDRLAESPETRPTGIRNLMDSRIPLGIAGVTMAVDSELLNPDTLHVSTLVNPGVISRAKNIGNFVSERSSVVEGMIDLVKANAERAYATINSDSQTIHAVSSVLARSEAQADLDRVNAVRRELAELSVEWDDLLARQNSIREQAARLYASSTEGNESSAQIALRVTSRVAADTAKLNAFLDAHVDWFIRFQGEYIAATRGASGTLGRGRLAASRRFQLFMEMLTAEMARPPREPTPPPVTPILIPEPEPEESRVSDLEPAGEEDEYEEDSSSESEDGWYCPICDSDAPCPHGPPT